MECNYCGAKENVRAFYHNLSGRWYKECRKCFETSMDLEGVPKTEWEEEWQRGVKEEWAQEQNIY